MKSQVLTEKIMRGVAYEEKRRLSRTLPIFGVLILGLLAVFIFSSHRTITGLIEKDFFRLLFHFEYDLDKIIPQLAKLGSHLWEEALEGFLVVSLISLILLLFVIRRSGITSLKRRLKQIGKYSQ